jgi:hypothetical protein
VASLRERWRAGRSEFLVLVGCLVAFAGNYGLLAWTLLSAPSSAWAGPAALTTAELVLCGVTPWVLSRPGPRTARRFAVTGTLASAIALLTVPGLVGGGIALAGATMGILATYEGLPDAPRS